MLLSQISLCVVVILARSVFAGYEGYDWLKSPFSHDTMFLVGFTACNQETPLVNPILH